MNGSPFLAKHYFDVVSDDGDWAIGYDVTLPFAGRHLRYRELTGSVVSRPRWTVRVPASEPPPEPSFRFGSCCADWEGSAVEQPIGYENDAVKWRLTGLRSRARVTTGGARIEGLGYGETLVLKRPPWLIGIDELWWGRYVSPRTFVTWIVADGALPIRFGVCDGTTSGEVRLDARGISVADARLDFGESQRRIASGDALRSRSWAVAGLCRLLGGRRLGLIQEKAVTRCAVKTPRSEESGWVMAEHVKLLRR